ncbi:MAG: hypothetical protein DRP45_10685 [Candidatus Zixiibacteriota bacterium]|nr:MAG: hypothetical protein DRP45_10685 [candidate division Zixibacteria bacterium]
MFSGTRKFVLIALFTALLITLVNLAWWFYYAETRDLLDDQLDRRLSAIALSASTAFPSDQVDQLAADSLEAYLRAIETLEQVRAADSLSEAFILDENYRYLATTALEPDSTYFLTELNGPCVDSLFFGEASKAALTPTYETGGLYLKSVFVPLRGDEGFVVAVLGVEANVGYFDSLSELRQNLYLATGLSLLGGILLGGLFLLLQRHINRTEQQLFLGQTHAHLGRMVAVVAHELRNPLMIIRASAERLQSKTEMPEARYVIEEVDRLDGIVTGYLDFARSGGTLLTGDTRESVDLAEMVTKVKKHLFDKHLNEQIEWLGGSSLPAIYVETYPRSLRQVLLNLLFNGVESCREAAKPTRVGIDIVDSRQSVQITVIDQGHGLTRKELRKVFAPFYSTKSYGSGLGLYLSRRIIHEMGGELGVSSEPNVETLVKITLPRQTGT